MWHGSVCCYVLVSDDDDFAATSRELNESKRQEQINSALLMGLVFVVGVVFGLSAVVVLPDVCLLLGEDPLSSLLFVENRVKVLFSLALIRYSVKKTHRSSE